MGVLDGGLHAEITQILVAAPVAVAMAAASLGDIVATNAV